VKGHVHSAFGGGVAVSFVIHDFVDGFDVKWVHSLQGWSEAAVDERKDGFVRFAGDLRGLSGFAVTDLPGFRLRFDDDVRQDTVPILGGGEILSERDFTRAGLYTLDSFGYNCLPSLSEKAKPAPPSPGFYLSEWSPFPGKNG